MVIAGIWVTGAGVKRDAIKNGRTASTTLPNGSRDMSDAAKIEYSIH